MKTEKTYYAKVKVYDVNDNFIADAVIDSYMQDENEAIKDIVVTVMNMYEKAERVVINEFFMLETEMKG